MKIKKIGWTSFLIYNDEISILTDPIALKKSGASFPKTSADVVLFSNYHEEIKESIISDNELEKKVVPDNREKIVEINNPGEYEVSGMMIRRDLGESFYMIDEKNLRVVYMGGTDKDFEIENSKDLGDVDVLIVPVGDGVNFMSFETIEKVISNADPALLIPCAYQEEGLKNKDLKTREEFIKHFGFPDVQDESYINVKKKKVEQDQKSVEVIFL